MLASWVVLRLEKFQLLGVEQGRQGADLAAPCTRPCEMMVSVLLILPRPGFSRLAQRFPESNSRIWLTSCMSELTRTVLGSVSSQVKIVN